MVSAPRLLDVLREVRELIDGYVDIRPGLNGALPNNAMKAQQAIDAALARHETQDAYPFWHVDLSIKAHATIETQAANAAQAEERARDLVSIHDVTLWEVVGVEAHCLTEAEDE